MKSLDQRLFNLKNNPDRIANPELIQQIKISSKDQSQLVREEIESSNPLRIGNTYFKEIISQTIRGTTSKELGL